VPIGFPYSRHPLALTSTYGPHGLRAGTTATKAVTRLKSAGIPESDISLVSGNESIRKPGSFESPGTSDTTAEHAGTGAAMGAALGGGAGLLAGLGVMAIPGLGVAAGWLASVLLGAATGGIIGALTGAGIPEGVVGVGEAVELTSELVLPFHAVEKVVPVAKDDDEDRRDLATWIIVAPIDDRSNQRQLIVWPQKAPTAVVG